MLIFIDQFFLNTFHYRCFYKNNRKSIRKHDLLLLGDQFIVVQIKNLNGVQNVYPRGTEFSGVQNGEMGDCTPKWGTFGSPVPNHSQSILIHFLSLATIRKIFLSIRSHSLRVRADGKFSTNSRVLICTMYPV